MAELCVGTCRKGVGTLELGQGEGRGNREGEFFPSSMIWKDIQNGPALVPTSAKARFDMVTSVLVIWEVAPALGHSDS